MKGLSRISLVLVLCAGTALGEEITVRTSRGIKITGELKSVTDRGIVLAFGRSEKKYAWHELSPRSAYEIKESRIDSQSPQAHIELGDYCAANELPELAKKEYLLALQIAPSLKGQIEEAIARIQTAKEPPGNQRKDSQPKPDEKSAEKIAEKPSVNAQPQAAEQNPPQKEESDTSLSLEEMLKDPAKYYEDWLAVQRLHLKQIEEKLQLKFFTYETDHYILHSTMSSDTTKRIGIACEDLYKKMSKAFDVKKGDMLWAGKCLVHLFEERKQFIDFAVKIDGATEEEAKNRGGYFAYNGRLVHIAIPANARGKQGFESTLIHEGAHAFLQLFRESVFIKPWIHEGVAQHFESQWFPNDPQWQAKRAIVRDAACHLSLASLRAPDTFVDMDARTMSTYYAHAWSALDFMLRAPANPKKFVKFLHALKDGKSEEEAIKEAFGKSMSDFERAWEAYVQNSF